MNKLSKIIALLIFVGFNSYAQKAELQSAMNYVKWNDLEKAKTSIDKCVTNESTMGMAKTWYWSGFIYQALYESTDEKYTVLKNGALEQSLNSYKKTKELDRSNDFADSIYFKVSKLRNIVSNNGYNAFQEKNYNKALELFELGVKIQLDFFSITDTIGIGNCALAANKSNQYLKASQYYSQIISLNASDEKTFVSLSNMYLYQNDTLRALEILKQGISKYPQDKDLASRQFSLYLISGKANEAFLEVEKSIQLDPTNANLYFNKGLLAKQLGKTIEEEASYKKAIELNGELYDALYNLGSLYFNQGVDIYNKANDIKDNAKYEAERKKSEAKFKLALPYLEKAFELNRKDTGVLQSLKVLYSRAGNQEKVNMINKAIEEAKK